MLDDLDQVGTPVAVPAPAADYGFRWELGDLVGRTWWPQGITSSADASDSDEVHGRRVLMVGWYAKRRGRLDLGARVSVVDVTDPLRPAYRHVLLVSPRPDRDGQVSMRPVVVHAGGLAWYGPALWVADTRGGIRVFDLDDVCRVPAAVEPGRGRAGFLGYRYVLPQRTAYDAENDDRAEPFRFSFISVDRSGGEHQLVAGEYGRGRQTTRLVRLALDPATGSPAFDDSGAARPLETVPAGPQGMQGATVVDGTWYVTNSRGPARGGTLWTRRPAQDFVAHEGVLTVGPEDLTYWRRHDRLWTCSEWPGLRFVYAMPRSRFA